MEIIGLGAWVAVAIMFLLRYLGKPTTVTLLQYQGGVLYKRGHPVREVATGQLRVWAGTERVIIADKRPTSVSFENQAVALSDGATAAFGFSGIAEVQNLSRVLYCARNYSELPAYVFLLYTRLVLNGSSSGRLLSSKDTIIQEIIDKSKPRLAAAGFDLRPFPFTHLSIAAPPQQSSVSRIAGRKE